MKLVYFSIYLIFVKIHEILKQILQKDWFCMKEWIITIIQIYITSLCISWGWYIRLTPLFVVSLCNTIHQGSNLQGRKEIRLHRLKYSGSSVQTKMFGMGRFFIEQLNHLLSALQYNQPYTTKTHLKSLFVKAQKEKKIVIHSIKKARKQPLIWESCALLGMKETCIILLSKQERCHLYKQFYEITFTRIK